MSRKDDGTLGQLLFAFMETKLEYPDDEYGRPHRRSPMPRRELLAFIEFSRDRHQAKGKTMLRVVEDWHKHRQILASAGAAAGMGPTRRIGTSYQRRIGT